MRIVMKFGGGLLTSGPRIAHSAGLVSDEIERGGEVVVVVSAMGGVTDRLLRAIELLRARDQDFDIDGFCEEMRVAHGEAARSSVSGDELKGAMEDLDELIAMLGETLEGYAESSSDLLADEIVSMGERLCASIFSRTLRSVGLDSRPLLGGEAGVITDSNHPGASPRMDICRMTVMERTGSLLEAGVTPVVTGFVGEDERGHTTTLGRGGSDFSASIIGSCLGADEIWIWKSVGGIMTANPEMVPEARTIPGLSYVEAAELAHFGAKVLHPKTMGPALENHIPIRVKDANRPLDDGTLITERTTSVPGTVKAVTSVESVGLISVYGTEMAGVPGVAARIFDALAAARVNVMMISQSSSETNITIVVPEDDLPICRESLGREFRGNDLVSDISYDEEISIVSVVGSGMRGTPGVAAKVFQSVAEAGVNVVMIAQGSSEVNISFVVERRDAERAVSSIHRHFDLGGRLGG